MAHNAVLTDTWEANILVPDDGDAANAASVETGFVDVGNRTLWNYNRTVEAVGGALVFPLAPFDYDGVNRWTFFLSLMAYQNSNVAGNEAMVVALPTLHNCDFDSVTAVVHGDGGGAGPHVGLPGTMPQIRLYRQTVSTATTAIVGTQADTSAGVAAYETIHTIVLSFGAQSYDGDSSYWLAIQGETGANSIAGALEVYGLSMNVVPA
jgi:hypothetical protein